MPHVFKPNMSQWVKNKLAYLPRSTPKPGPMGGNRPRPASKLQQGTYFYLKTIINLSQTLFVKTKLATIHHCIFALAQGLPTSLPGTEPLQKARKFKTTFSPYNFCCCYWSSGFYAAVAAATASAAATGALVFSHPRQNV